MNRSWRDSWIYGAWWRFKEVLYNWWYPKDKRLLNSYSRRRLSRLVLWFHALQNLLGISLLLRVWSNRRSGEAGNPDSNEGAPASVRRSNLSWKRISEKLGSSFPIRIYREISNTLYNWYHPVAEDVHGYAGHYGRRRRSRHLLLWDTLCASVHRSWLGRFLDQLSHRFYNWWYPAAPAKGYASRRRSNRAVLLWLTVWGRLRDSSLGRTLGSAGFHIYEWWYPPLSPGDMAGASYQYRRVSRPVTAYRRWNRWFRTTWFGKQFGWILDEIVHALSYLRDRIAYDLSWDSLQQFFSRPRNVVLCFVVTAALISGYRYGMPRYRQYQERTYAAQAQRYLEKKDYARAHLRARQTLAINQENPAATLVNAEIADLANSPLALYWRQRAALLSPTLTNKLALVATAMRFETFPFRIASQTLVEVEPECATNIAFHLMSGALKVKLGKIQEAGAHYGKAVELDPNNSAAKMSQAVVSLQSTNADLFVGSRATLEWLHQQGELGILPLRSLIAESLNRRDYPRAEQLSVQALTNSHAAFSDRMVHLSILRASGSSNYAGFLKQMQSDSTRNPSQAGALASWLIQSGATDEAMTWLQQLPEDIRNVPMLRLAMADGYVARQEWQTLDAFLENERWGALEHVRLGMLAMCARQLGENDRQKLAWQRAIALASANPTALQTLVQMASNWNWPVELETALWTAVERFPKQTWAIDSLKQLFTQQKSTPGFRRLYQVILRHDPSDRVAKNNYAILSMLVLKDLRKAHEYAAEVFKSEPENPTFISTYAFSLHLQGRTAEGINLLKGLPTASLQEPSMALYYGVLLVAAGQPQDAKLFLEKSQSGFMLPEESALLNSARRQIH